jgi:hypothetical protein
MDARKKIRALCDWAIYGRPIAYEWHRTVNGFTVYAVHKCNGHEVLSDAYNADFETEKGAANAVRDAVRGLY